jgi:hypothetical protein
MQTDQLAATAASRRRRSACTFVLTMAFGVGLAAQSPSLQIDSYRSQLLVDGISTMQLDHVHLGTQMALRAEFTADVESILVIATPAPYPAAILISTLSPSPVQFPGLLQFALTPGLVEIVYPAGGTRQGLASRFGGSTVLRVPTALLPRNCTLGAQALLWINNQPVLSELIVLTT